MLIINNKIIPFGKSYIAINLFGVVFAKQRLSSICVLHEKIHTAQQKELLFVVFYILYVLEWLIRLLQYRNAHKAYRAISFEQEAYENEHKTDYLKIRRHYHWLRYVFTTE